MTARPIAQIAKVLFMAFALLLVIGYWYGDASERPRPVQYAAWRPAELPLASGADSGQRS